MTPENPTKNSIESSIASMEAAQESIDKQIESLKATILANEAIIRYVKVVEMQDQHTKDDLEQQLKAAHERIELLETTLMANRLLIKEKANKFLEGDK